MRPETRRIFQASVPLQHAANFPDAIKTAGERFRVRMLTQDAEILGNVVQSKTLSQTNHQIPIECEVQAFIEAAYRFDCRPSEERGLLQHVVVQKGESPEIERLYGKA